MLLRLAKKSLFLSPATGSGADSLAERAEVLHGPRVALDLKWLHAQFNLGFKVVVHYLAKLNPFRTRYGLERFQQNYVVEGLPPSTVALRQMGPEAGRCTTCGVCDGVCPILSGHRDFMGPMAFVVAGARSTTLLQDVKESLAILTSPTCTDCKRCEQACPEGIPILGLAAGLQAQGQVIVDARAGKLPIRAADVKALAAKAGR